MSISSSWVHGNALRIESPFHFNPRGEQNGQLILTPFGWGAEVSNEGHPVVSWMHLPIPTINGRINRFEFELLRVFLLFQCSDASIENVHIYDGHEKVQEFNDLSLEGGFLAKSSRNTFELKKRHQVKRGISLSFFFKARILTGTGGGGAVPPGKLLVAAAGAEFETRNRAFSTVRDLLSRLFP